MKKLICVFLALLLMLPLASCGNNIKEDSSTTQKADTTEPKTAPDADAFVWAMDGVYRIYHGDTDENHLFFFYDLYNAEGKTVKSECTYMAQPKIEILESNTLKVSVQSGNGRYNLFTYYYNRDTDTFSQTYDYVLCESDSLIAYYIQPSTVVVRHMFDNTGYNKEIKLNVSNDAEPVSSASFVNNNEVLEITYSTGTDRKQITEQFTLD